MGDETATALFLKAGDDLHRLGRVEDAGSGGETFDAFAVIHRGPETFTHIYLVPRRPMKARVEVQLGAVLDGEAPSAARRWLADRFALRSRLRDAVPAD